MNIKVATKYQLSEYKRSVCIFYLIVIIIMVFFGVASSISSSGNFVNVGGTEMSTMIFLFVLGINSFRETFLMMLQNGTTRKTMFIGRLITILATSIVMSIVNRLIIILGGLYTNVNERYTVGGMYENAFSNRVESLHVVTRNLEATLITIGLYCVAMVAGYFITTAYYRMNKILKVVVSIGVPSLFFILIPLLDMAIFKGKLMGTINRVIEFACGGKTGNPYNLLISCILIIAIGSGLSWLLIRKAVEKE